MKRTEAQVGVGTLDQLVRQKIEAMRQRALDQKATGWDVVQMMLPKRGRIPGFPRGEFVAEYETHNAYAINCDKLIAWANRQLANPSVLPPAAPAGREQRVVGPEN